MSAMTQKHPSIPEGWPVFRDRLRIEAALDAERGIHQDASSSSHMCITFPFSHSQGYGGRPFTLDMYAAET